MKGSTNEDLCPECGHLISRNLWDCQFCGRSLQDLHIHNTGMNSWDDYSGIDNMASFDRDISWKSVKEDWPANDDFF
jgi:hypothetical protein